jgi:tetratricopeptide (TPR) repeat protein/predicted Ser/Thr protein kinase
MTPPSDPVLSTLDPRLQETGSGETLVQDQHAARGDQLELSLDPSRFGHYVLLEKLGQGGMGVVFAAFDTKLDRKVAIKILRAPDGEGSRIRMIREAQALARVSHPNVVQVYEIGEREQLTFLVMEFVEGLTLGAWLAERPRPQREIVETFVAAGRGLAAAHEKGLVHRDFKPDNVMIRRDGQVLVMDFGLARQNQAGAPREPSLAQTSSLELELTHAGAMLGTPNYMAPEQFIGWTTDARTDQFSFCVALWEALYKQRPFQGESLAKLSLAVIEGRITQPRHGDVPAWLRRVLERGLARDPAQRWPSMLQLLDALARDPSRRRRGLVLGASTLALLGVLLGGGLAWRGQQRSAVVEECERHGRAIEADWNEDVADRIEQAFVATGLGFASSAWAHTRPWIDDYARSWSELRTQTCLELQLEQSRDETSHDSVVDCLDEQRTTFAGLLAAWADADGRTVSSATVAAAGLLPVSTCTNELLASRMRAPASVRSEVASARSKLDQVRALQLAGEYEQGLAHAQELVGEAERLGWRPLQAEAWLMLGTLQSSLGKYEEARDARMQAFFHALAGGDDQTMLAAAIGLTHNVGYELAQYEAGRQWGKTGEMLIERLGLAGTLQESRLWAAIGGVQMTAGNYDEALSYFRRSFASKEAALGPNHPHVAQALDRMGVALYSQRETVAALDCFRRSLAIFEAALGSDHPDVGNALSNLAAVLTHVEKHEEALDLNYRALAIREAALGPEHPDVGASLGNIGVLLHAQGHHQLALEHSQRALAILETALGPSHPEVAVAHAALGGMHMQQRDYHVALEHHRRALAIRETTLGAEHPEVGESHYQVGAALLEQGDHAAALGSLRTALAIREDAHGPDHIEVGRILAKIGWAQRELGERDGARESLQRALAIGVREGDAKLVTEVDDQLVRLEGLSPPSRR